MKAQMTVKVRRVKLIANVPAGLACVEDESESVPTHPYLGQVGVVIEEYDTGYDAERPTGYEPVMHLVEFEDGKRLWIPWSTYLGFDECDKDKFCRHLEVQ